MIIKYNNYLVFIDPPYDNNRNFYFYLCSPYNQSLELSTKVFNRYIIYFSSGYNIDYCFLISNYNKKIEYLIYNEEHGFKFQFESKYKYICFLIEKYDNLINIIHNIVRHYAY